jgi:hypothetical protein
MIRTNFARLGLPPEAQRAQGGCLNYAKASLAFPKLEERKVWPHVFVYTYTKFYKNKNPWGEKPRDNNKHIR